MNVRMSAPYIPNTDADFDAWQSNFCSLIAGAPATYGLLVGDATAISAQGTAWHAAYLIATSPSTRTPDTVQAKVTAKLNALATFRPYAQRIANNVGISSGLKVGLGVNPRTNGPTKITAPTTNPVLSVPTMFTLGFVVRFRDSMASPSVKAKPPGAVALELYCASSATPITDPTLLTFKGLQTKSPFSLTFGSGEAGKTQYLAGRWVTRKGLIGPWSSIINHVVPQ